MGMLRANRGLIAAVSVLLCGQLTVAAEPTSVSSEVTVTSDYLFRGVSQTLGAPALIGGLTVEHPSGWFGDIRVSNVEFTDPDVEEDGPRIEVDLEAGYYYQLTDSIAASLSWATYVFPGSYAAPDYDYSEFIGMVYIHDRHYATVAYSDDVFASGMEGSFYALGTFVNLPANSALNIEFGHYDLDRAFGDSYRYAHLSLDWSIETLDISIGYVQTSQSAKEIFGDQATDKHFTLSLGTSF